MEVQKTSEGTVINIKSVNGNVSVLLTRREARKLKEVLYRYFHPTNKS